MLTALSEAEGLRYPHPSSLRRTSMYASFLRISEALHLDIFHQPLSSRFFDRFAISGQLGPPPEPCPEPLFIIYSSVLVSRHSSPFGPELTAEGLVTRYFFMTPDSCSLSVFAQLDTRYLMLASSEGTQQPTT
jgi:hypothetical protein